jgi:predicted ATPase
MSDEIKYIKRIEISKLWGKFDIEWNLHPDVNILAGGNGSGKSTILNLILKCLGYYYLHASIFNIENIKIVFDTADDIIFRHTEGIPKVPMPALTTKTVSYISYQNNTALLIAANLTNDLKGGLTESEKHTYEALQKLNINFINTFDQLLKDKETISKVSDTNTLTTLDFEVNKLQKQYLDYQLNLGKRKDAINDKFDNPKEEITKLRHSQNRFLEIIDELFKETGKKANRETNEITFLLEGKPILAYQLSSGEKQILIILLTVLIQDNKQAILFMDEPETSLHIDWQQKLIGYIRELNPNIQLIIATHSPAIIMEGWLDKVFNVSDIIVKNHQVTKK